MPSGSRSLGVVASCRGWSSAVSTSTASNRPHVVVAGELVEGPILLADFDGDPSVLALDLPIELVVAPAAFEDGITRPLYRWTASSDTAST